MDTNSADSRALRVKEKLNRPEKGEFSDKKEQVGCKLHYRVRKNTKNREMAGKTENLH